MIEYSKLQDLPAHYKVKYGLKPGIPNNHYYSGRRFKELYDSISRELDYLKNYKNNLIEDPTLVEIISGEEPKPIKKIYLDRFTVEEKRVRDMLSKNLRYTARNNTFIILPWYYTIWCFFTDSKGDLKDDVTVAAPSPANLLLILLLLLLVLLLLPSAPARCPKPCCSKTPAALNPCWS